MIRKTDLVRIRRLLDRTIKLHVRKVTTSYYPDSHTSLAKANELNKRMVTAARDAKARLLAEIVDSHRDR